MQLQRRFVGFIVVIQTVLFLTHLLLYETWTFSLPGTDQAAASWIKLALGILSVSFVAASLLAFRYTNAAVRIFYRLAAVWIGFLTFLFFASIASLIGFCVTRFARLNLNFHRSVELLFGIAVLTG